MTYFLFTAEEYKPEDKNVEDYQNLSFYEIRQKIATDHSFEEIQNQNPRIVRWKIRGDSTHYNLKLANDTYFNDIFIDIKDINTFFYPNNCFYYDNYVYFFVPVEYQLKTNSYIHVEGYIVEYETYTIEGMIRSAQKEDNNYKLIFSNITVGNISNMGVWDCLKHYDNVTCGNNTTYYFSIFSDDTFFYADEYLDIHIKNIGLRSILTVEYYKINDQKYLRTIHV